MSTSDSPTSLSEASIRYLRETHERGLSGLQFPPELEALFASTFRNSNYTINRIYAVAGAFVLVCFLIADRLVIPQLVEQTLWLRASGAAFVLMVAALSHFRIFRPLFHALLGIGALAIHLSIIAIGVLAAQAGNYHYQTGAIISLFYALAVLRLPFNAVFPLALILWMLQILGMHAFMQLPTHQFVELAFVNSFVVVISLLVSYRYEYETRRNFLQQLLLKHEQSALQAAEKHLMEQALLDPLTQLANRRAFNQFMDREWRRARRDGLPFTLIMIDVDNFKAYNDHYGHQAGDACLTELARCFEGFARRGADMAVRFGGEEFALVLPDTDAVAAAEIAHRLVRQVEALGLPHERAPEGVVTISAGYATVIPDEHLDYEALISRADEALYKAKRTGKNRACPYVSDNKDNQHLR
ncbi:MAG: GGDEF domain-containing protein [Gammaproteobacteria bacterium]|nr:MAG: GGDEF domain-containing protein [Gammaproteobacteria bacterium]